MKNYYINKYYLFRENKALAASILGASILLASPLYAVEGGIGRSITGMQISPLNAALPSETGVIFSISSINYDGKISHSKNTALAGRIVGNVDYNISYNLLNAIYVWKGNEQWSFASSVGVPFQHTDITASLYGPHNTYRKGDRNTQLADIVFSPILASYHVNPLNHLLFGLTVFAPTGSYHKDRLANAGQNTWTFVPNIAYTMILPQDNIELTAVGALEFYTRNKDTDYRNGMIARMDAIALKRFGASGWGAGLNIGWIEQLKDDKGPLASKLGGNRARSFGMGPIISYEQKIGGTTVSSSLRWVHEFDVKNRPKGNAFQLSFTAQF